MEGSIGLWIYQNVCSTDIDVKNRKYYGVSDESLHENRILLHEYTHVNTYISHLESSVYILPVASLGKKIVSAIF